MKTIFRFFISFFGFTTMYLIVVVLVLGNLWPHGGYVIHDVIAFIAALIFAVFLFIITKNLSRNLVDCILWGGFIIGAVCFALGFFGPIIFYPSANQGPLLGILITGPLGFLLGMIGGGIYWRLKLKSKKE